MFTRHSNRASAVLMVVGLLSILALLGASFLVVAYTDRQQSRAMAARAQADPAAQGFVSAWAAAFAKGLGFAAWTGAPSYSNPSLTWVQFVDSPAIAPNTSWMSPYFYWQGQMGPPVGAADADADGAPDSFLFPTGLYNSLGDPYYLAAKITDPSGLLCLNTAGSADPAVHTLWPGRTGSAVDLRGFLGANNYMEVHARRCGNPNLNTLRDYDLVCGRRLFQPLANPPTVPQPLPFAIGDEMYLRWMRTSGTIPTNTGRVFEALPPSALSPAARSVLTTYSVSRQAVRRPDANAGPNQLLTRMVPDVTSEAGMQATYERALVMLRHLGLGSGENSRRRMAACFVANLNAYRNAAEANAPWAFRPKLPGTTTDENFTAYGLVQRLVITEAYAGGRGNSTSVPAPSNDWYKGYAIEIFNPSDSNVSWNGEKYNLELNGTALAVTGAGTINIPPKGRIVIWNAEGGGTVPAPEANVGFPVPQPSNWFRAPNLTFENDGVLRLRRASGADNVPVDQVSCTASDLDYHVADVASSGNVSVGVDIRRDDDENRARYNIAAYERFTGNPSMSLHRLGQANSLTFPNPAIDAVAKYGAPIHRAQAFPVDIGELTLLYLTGPIIDNGNPICFPVAIARNEAPFDLGNLVRKDVRVRGRLDADPNSLADGAYFASAYPDVPVGCLLSELFTLIPSDVARPVASPGWSGSWAQSQQVYGRINVNTAPFEVLKRLPYPATIVHPVTGAALTVDPSVAAAYIQAYRDRTALPGTRDYSARRADPNGARVAGLRAGSDVACILTPDEVAVPLADYANHLMGWDNYTAAAPSGPSGPLDQYARYVLARDAIWRPISNLITVNTDVAIANVCVQLGTPTASQPQGKARWYYIIALDRSNCVTPADLPAVILFSEVK